MAPRRSKNNRKGKPRHEDAIPRPPRHRRDAMMRGEPPEKWEMRWWHAHKHKIRTGHWAVPPVPNASVKNAPNDALEPSREPQVPSGQCVDIGRAQQPDAMEITKEEVTAREDRHRRASTLTPRPTPPRRVKLAHLGVVPSSPPALNTPAVKAAADVAAESPSLFQDMLAKLGELSPPGPEELHQEQEEMSEPDLPNLPTLIPRHRSLVVESIDRLSDLFSDLGPTQHPQRAVGHDTWDPEIPWQVDDMVVCPSVREEALPARKATAPAPDDNDDSSDSDASSSGSDDNFVSPLPIPEPKDSDEWKPSDTDEPFSDHNLSEDVSSQAKRPDDKLALHSAASSENEPATLRAGSNAQVPIDIPDNNGSQRPMEPTADTIALRKWAQNNLDDSSPSAAFAQRFVLLMSSYSGYLNCPVIDRTAVAVGPRFRDYGIELPSMEQLMRFRPDLSNGRSWADTSTLQYILGPLVHNLPASSRDVILSNASLVDTYCGLGGSQLMVDLQTQQDAQTGRAAEAISDVLEQALHTLQNKHKLSEEELRKLRFSWFGGDNLPAHKTRILFPLNIRDIHWVPVAFVKLSEIRGRIIVGDSMGEFNRAIIEPRLVRLAECTRDPDGPFANVIWDKQVYYPADRPQQGNGDDCGFYTADWIINSHENTPRAPVPSAERLTQGHNIRLALLDRVVNASNSLLEYGAGQADNAVKEVDSSLDPSTVHSSTARAATTVSTTAAVKAVPADTKAYTVAKTTQSKSAGPATESAQVAKSVGTATKPSGTGSKSTRGGTATKAIRGAKSSASTTKAVGGDKLATKSTRGDKLAKRKTTLEDLAKALESETPEVVNEDSVFVTLARHKNLLILVKSFLYKEGPKPLVGILGMARDHLRAEGGQKPVPFELLDEPVQERIVLAVLLDIPDFVQVDEAQSDDLDLFALLDPTAVSAGQRLAPFPQRALDTVWDLALNKSAQVPLQALLLENDEHCMEPLRKNVTSDLESHAYLAIVPIRHSWAPTKRGQDKKDEEAAVAIAHRYSRLLQRPREPTMVETGADFADNEHERYFWTPFLGPHRTSAVKPIIGANDIEDRRLRDVLGSFEALAVAQGKTYTVEIVMVGYDAFTSDVNAFTELVDTFPGLDFQLVFAIIDWRDPIPHLGVADRLVSRVWHTISAKVFNSAATVAEDEDEKEDDTAAKLRSNADKCQQRFAVILRSILVLIHARKLIASMAARYVFGRGPAIVVEKSLSHAASFHLSGGHSRVINAAF